MHRDIYSRVARMIVCGLLGVVSALSPPLSSAQATDTSPAGMVAFFPQSQCPDGWEPATYAQGRLLLGVTDLTSYDLAKTTGTALTNLEAPAHQHPFAVTLDLAEKHLSGGDCGGDTGNAVHKGSYTVNGPTQSGGSSDLPLFQILACEKKDSGQSPPPTDGYGTSAVAFFNLPACPANWQPAIGYPQGNTESAPSSPVDGYFVMPFEAPPDGTVGTLVGNPYGNGEQRTHSHALTSSISLGSYQYEVFLGSCSNLTSDGAHSFSGTTSASFDNVPYVQLLMCEREPNFSSANPPPVPSDIVTFFSSQNCPYPWKSSSTGTGRFLVGLPDGGTPNEAFGSGTPLTNPGDRIPHSHGLKGSITLSNVQHVALAKGSDSDKFGTTGTYEYGGTTNPANFDLPYLTTANCQPCTGPNDADPVCSEQSTGKP